MSAWSSVAVAAMVATAADPSLSAAQVESVKAAWHKLTPQEVEAKPADAMPDGVKVAKVDVSQRIRSASFGHKTTLLVRMSEAGEPAEFWVQHGRSTNSPARLFGPFSMSAEPAAK